MDLDSAHMMAVSKVPMLKPGEFEIWRMRIEQYIQMMYYALWDIIKNGPSLLKEQVVEGVTTMMPITSVEDKAQRRLEVKARSTLMLSIPKEHQLKFNFIKDAKQLMEAIEKRFVNTTHEVTTASSQVDTVNSTTIDNLSDVVICAFLKSQPSCPQLVNEDLEQIHPDDLEEMDLKWQMAMLNMRAKRLLKKIGRKLTVSGNETIGFHKTNVECYNYHKRGNFSRECRAPKSQDTKHNENTRGNVPVKTPASKALVSCDGLGGYDLSDQAEEGPNHALMAYTSLTSNSKVSNDSICTKSGLETVKILKSQNEQLTKDLKKLELMVLGYKLGSESVEERLKFFKTNKSVYLKDITLLKVEIQMKDIAITEIRRKLDLAQKEKDNIHLAVDKLKNASKSLNKLIDCKIVDNYKRGLGYANYNAVSLPYTGDFLPLKPDLSFTGLDEFVNKSEVDNCDAKTSNVKPKDVRKNIDALIIKEWVSDDKDEEVTQPKIEQKIVKPSIAKIEFVKTKQPEKKARKTVKQAKTVNEEVQLQALVDRKRIIITESTVRRDLQLEDSGGVDCLPNATIFEQLALIGFVQVFLDKQLEGMSNYDRIYVTPSHTKKIFRNMRRVGKGFSRKETPLFPTMMVHNQEEIGKGSPIPTDPHHTPTFIQPSPQPQKTQKHRKPRIKVTEVPQPSDPVEHVLDEAVNKELDDSLVRAATTAFSLEAKQDSGNINNTQSKATPNVTPLKMCVAAKYYLGALLLNTTAQDIGERSLDVV
nr:ribonuclease H-like domain-containing protein [Tanacetum cinerariifolium]